MNKPIRTMSIFCMLLFVALLLNATYLQYWQADSLNSLSQHPDNKRVRDAEFSRKRGAILVRRQGRSPRATSPTTTTSTSASTRRPASTPTSPATSPATAGLGGIESSQNSILSGSDPRLFVNRVVDMRRQQPAQGRLRHADRRPQGADRRRTTACGRSATTCRARWSRSSRAPARSWRWSPARRTTPTGSPATTSPTCRQGQAAAQRRPSRARCDNRAIQETLPPGSTFKLVTAAAALTSGKYTPDTKVPGGASLDLPQTTHEPRQRERRQLRRRPDHADPGARGLLQRLLRRRSASSSATTRCATQAEKFGFGTRPPRPRRPHRPGRSAASPRTPTSRRPRCRRSASSTSRPPRCRWRWSPPGIANDGTVMQPYLVDEVQSPDLSSRSTRPTPSRCPTSRAMSSVGGARPDPDDGRGRRQRHRHRPRRSPASRWPARPAPRRARPTGRRTPGSSRSPRPTTPRSRSRCWCRTPAWRATRSPAAAWPPRSPRPSWRR